MTLLTVTVTSTSWYYIASCYQAYHRSILTVLFFKRIESCLVSFLSQKSCQQLTIWLSLVDLELDHYVADSKVAKISNRAYADYLGQLYSWSAGVEWGRRLHEPLCKDCTAHWRDAASQVTQKMNSLFPLSNKTRETAITRKRNGLKTRFDLHFVAKCMKIILDLELDSQI